MFEERRRKFYENLKPTQKELKIIEYMDLNAHKAFRAVDIRRKFGEELRYANLQSYNTTLGRIANAKKVRRIIKGLYTSNNFSGSIEEAIAQNPIRWAGNYKKENGPVVIVKGASEDYQTITNQPKRSPKGASNIILEYMSRSPDKTFRVKDLKRELNSIYRYRRTTYSNALSRLYYNGKIKKIYPGLYKVVESMIVPKKGTYVPDITGDEYEPTKAVSPVVVKQGWIQRIKSKLIDHSEKTEDFTAPLEERHEENYYNEVQLRALIVMLCGIVTGLSIEVKDKDTLEFAQSIAKKFNVDSPLSDIKIKR